MAETRPEMTNERVDQFMASLEHSRKAELEQLRTAILASNKQISEQIKWKAPSFVYAGEDRVTFRIAPGDMFQLVFHRGAKVKADSREFTFDDSAGILTWVADDRATLTLQDADDLNAKQADIVDTVNRWVVS